MVETVVDSIFAIKNDKNFNTERCDHMIALY